MTVLIGVLMYFGALIIPLVYLLSTHARDACTRPMLVGVALQLSLSMAVWAFVYFSWRSGYTEYYWGWALLLPVNVLSLVYFLVILFLHARRVAE